MHKIPQALSGLRMSSETKLESKTNERTVMYYTADEWKALTVEELAFNIQPGQTPETDESARLLRDWTQEWLDAQKVAQ